MDDQKKLLAAAAERDNQYLAPMIALAIETAMRRGELLSIRWADFSSTQKTIRLTQTKNGYERIIHLTPCAIEVLNSLPRISDRIFPTTSNAIRLCWNRTTSKAGLKGTRFHDLRHEAISRFSEKGLTIPEVAALSGHRSYAMLFRYCHPLAHRISKALEDPNVQTNKDSAEKSSTH